MAKMTDAEIENLWSLALGASRGDRSAQWEIVKTLYDGAKQRGINWLSVSKLIGRCIGYGILTGDEARAIVGDQYENVDGLMDEVKRRCGIEEGN
jgi:hypothetical protein